MLPIPNKPNARVPRLKPGSLWATGHTTHIMPVGREPNYISHEKGSIFMFVANEPHTTWPEKQYTFLGSDGLTYKLSPYGIREIFGLYNDE
jgi:hypothetical protein